MTSQTKANTTSNHINPRDYLIGDHDDGFLSGIDEAARNALNHGHSIFVIEMGFFDKPQDNAKPYATFTTVMASDTAENATQSAIEFLKKHPESAGTSLKAIESPREALHADEIANIKFVVNNANGNLVRRSYICAEDTIEWTCSYENNDTWKIRGKAVNKDEMTIAIIKELANRDDGDKAWMMNTFFDPNKVNTKYLSNYDYMAGDHENRFAIGIDEAITDAFNNDYSLYHVEIGFYDESENPDQPYYTTVVIAAGTDEKYATDSAIEFLQKHPEPTGTSFKLTGRPQRILRDYDIDSIKSVVSDSDGESIRKAFVCIAKLVDRQCSYENDSTWKYKDKLLDRNEMTKSIIKEMVAKDAHNNEWIMRTFFDSNRNRMS